MPDADIQSPMWCPKCRSRTTVNETREAGATLRRRRFCSSLACGYRFTTVELFRGPKPMLDMTVVDKAVLRRLRTRMQTLLVDFEVVLGGDEVLLDEGGCDGSDA